MPHSQTSVVLSLAESFVGSRSVSALEDSVLHSHWSRFNEARLLLVESFKVILLAFIGALVP